MKQSENGMMRILLLAAVLGLIAPGTVAALTISGTKHDLSYGASRTVTYMAATDDPLAGGTNQVCVFCHTPHGGNTDAPLWNRANTQTGYTPYTSDVLSALGITGDNPSSGAVHVKTRICLTCHDGTVALGNVANMPNEISSMFYSEIQMKNGQSMIQTQSPGYIGLDLSDDHPVAIRQNGGSGTGQDPELLTSVTGKVRLYKQSGNRIVVDNANGNYVECTSCHDAHDNRYGNFLIDTNSSSKICTSCHAKQIGAAVTPAHDGATVSYDPDGAGSIGGTVGAVKCMNCHYSHKAGVNPSSPTTPNAAGYGKYLLSFQEEGTCFNVPNRWGRSVNVCHASGAPNPPAGGHDIRTQESKPSAHNVSAFGKNYEGRHQALEAVTGGAGGYGWLDINNNWHVECNDCHNPHSAGNADHVAPTNIIAASNPLYGAGGVTVNWAGLGAWTTPASGRYTAFESLGLTKSTGMPASYYEYQICFKCHSSFAWGLNSGNIPPSPSFGGASKMTDQAQEFNQNNTAANGASMHPVAGPTGRVYGTLFTPWQAARGSQTMYCSDCHGSNTLGAPNGPHGSSATFGDSLATGFILVSNFSDTYGARGSASPQPGADLCFNCHDPNVYLSPVAGLTGGTGFSVAGTSVNLHTQHAYRSANPIVVTSPYPYRCVNCHTRVPHGYSRKAMIVLKNEGTPYEAGATGFGKINTLNGGVLPSSNNYNAARGTDCNSTANGCHQ